MGFEQPKRLCPYCLKKGKDKLLTYQALRIHVRREHFGKRCEVCGMAFPNECSTRMHVVRKAIGGCKEHMAYYGFVNHSHFGTITEQKRKSKAFRSECINMAINISPKMETTV
jgi:hypothetical protein